MAVNDEVMNNLAQYEGGSLNERIYNFLGNLGYTGTLSDRLSKYSSEGRKGWQGLLEDLGIWTPAQLFSQGDQGLFFVPKPVLFGSQALHQDSAGTTLTDANGDPVGLGLEWSQGLELGPELVSNGGPFTDTSGWSPSAGATLSVNSDLLRLTGDGGEDNASYSLTGLTVGRSYEVTLRIANETQTSGSPFYNIFGATSNTAFNGSVDVSVIAKADNTTESVLVSLGGASVSGEFIEIERLSVRELPGNHLTQSVSADRPTYNTDGSLHWLEFDGVEGRLETPYTSTMKNAFSVFCAGRADAAGTQWFTNIGGAPSTANTFIFIRPNGSSSGIRIGSEVYSYNFGVAAGEKFLCEVHVTSDLVQWYLNGTLVNEVSASVSPFDLSGNISLGGSNEDTEHFNGGVFGMVFVEYAASDSDRSDARNYLAKLAGITL